MGLYLKFTFNKIPFYSGFGLDRFNIGLHLYINYFLTDYDENRLLSLDITYIINGEYISVNFKSLNKPDSKQMLDNKSIIMSNCK